MRVLAVILLLACGGAWAQVKKEPKAPNLIKQNPAMAKEARQLDAASKTMKKRREKPAENSKRNQR